MVLSLNVNKLRSEYALMGVMYSGAMKRRVAEPLGMNLTPQS